MSSARADEPDTDVLDDAAGRAAVHYITRTWAEADLDHLPPENRYEIFDGGLLVTPPATWEHQQRGRWLFLALIQAAPVGWEVFWDVGIACGENRFVPDLSVFGADTPAPERLWSPSTPVLAVEIGSPSTVRADKRVKLQAYAEAKIPHYWRVDLDGRLIVHRLLDGETGYDRGETVERGARIELAEPFPLTIEVPTDLSS